MTAEGLGRYDLSRTKSVLEEMRNILNCSKCQKVAANPFTLGNCSHFFCADCLASYSGGRCPVTGCHASAPVKAAYPHKTMHSLTKSVYRISEILGEQVPETLKRLMSSDFQEDESMAQESTAQESTATEFNSSPKSIKRKYRADEDLENFAPTKHRRSKSVAPSVRPSKRQVEFPSAGADTVIAKSVLTEQQPAAGLNPREDLPISRTNSRRSKTVLSSFKANKHAERSKDVLVEKKNWKGETRMHAACVKGDVQTVLSLLARGANPNTVDNAGWTPLHEVSVTGGVDIVKLLLEHGASPNLHAQEGNVTPLHEAASHGHVEVVRLLVAHGADFKAKNSQGKCPGEVTLSSEVAEALQETERMITSSQALNQSIIVQDVLKVENVVLSCPDVTDSEFKKICMVAKWLKMRKPSRATSETTTHCLLNDPSNLNNILCAQLTGAQLLDTEWIYQSRQIGQLADTELFLLKYPDLVQEGRGRSRDCRLRGQPRLFTGLYFALSGGFDHNKLSKSDLQKLILISGAKLISRSPDPENLPENEKTVPHHAEEGSPLARTSHIILYQEGGKRGPELKYNMEHVKTLPLVWFVQSILQHKLLHPDLFSQ